jgi:hypothetical protein
VLALVVAWALFVPMADWLAHHDTDLTNSDLAFAEDLSEATFTAANLAGVRWPEGEPVPEGWKLNAGTGRLQVG